MNPKHDRKTWPAGVEAADLPEQAQLQAERWANTPCEPECEEEYPPRLIDLARALDWRRSLRELWAILRDRV